MSSSSALINVTVIDVNDNEPQFTSSSYETSLTEDAVVGMTVLTLRAVDADLGLNAQLEYLLMYSVIQLEYLLDDDGLQQPSHHFHVNRSSGALTLAKPLDFEVISLFTLDVVVKDCGHYPLSQQTTVVVFVLDVNDNAPSILLHPPIRFSSLSGDRGGPDNEVELSEQARPDTFIAHLSVDDRDSADNGRVSCFLGGFDVGGLFSLRQLHRGEYAVTLSGGRRLDRERRRRYEVTVTCADHGQPSAVSILALSVIVVEENDNAPEFHVNPVVTSLRVISYVTRDSPLYDVTIVTGILRPQYPVSHCAVIRLRFPR